MSSTYRTVAKILKFLFFKLFFFVGEKSGNEQEEVALQNASKQIVQTAILQAVQQVSQESQQKEKRVNSSVSLQLERGELTKKHEKK
ncbi:A-kinase anchor protein inhibitor 1 [Emys orbicularis]|uniref:A-kinase anchor protein inhibitor 1 n=1 Tax=Emys orbicularis TaxID=82168 RepID=UPI0031FBD8F4